METRQSDHAVTSLRWWTFIAAAVATDLWWHYWGQIFTTPLHNYYRDIFEDHPWLTQVMPFAWPALVAYVASLTLAKSKKHPIAMRIAVFISVFALMAVLLVVFRAVDLHMPHWREV